MIIMFINSSKRARWQNVGKFAYCYYYDTIYQNAYIIFFVNVYIKHSFSLASVWALRGLRKFYIVNKVMTVIILNTFYIYDKFMKGLWEANIKPKCACNGS